METLISKVFDQSLSVGIMLVVFWYQRQDRKELITMIEKISAERAELKSTLIEKLAENKSLIQQVYDKCK